MASGAADGKWRVVGKSKKSGDRRKALGESNAVSAAAAAALSSGVPLKTSLYELGFEKIMKKQNKEQVPPNAANSSAAAQPNKKPQQSAGKKASGGGGGSAAPAPKKSHTLEEALRALDLAELQREMEKSQNMFPENPQIWVKDLAGYLNEKLQTPKCDPVPTHQSHDYPYCLVSKELKSIIRSVLHKAPGMLELFVDYCILLMQQEVDKPAGDSVHGYRICIQAVLLDKPKIVTLNLKKYLEMLRSHQNRTSKSLSLMWAIGQAGYHDLAEGLKIWLGLMMPVLGIKTLSPYAISYLQRLLLMHSNLTKGFGMIGPKDFFPLLDFAFMPNNSLPASQQEQLLALYPRLKVLAFGATPENTLHTYFPSFLSRATPNCPAVMRKELLHSLHECLNLDRLSFSVWRQLYTKHLSQSSLLLQHLLQSWDTLSKPMRKSVQETAQSFCVTNKAFSSKTPNYKETEACESACQTLLHKMKGRQIPTFRIFLVALVFASGFVIHDIRSHGSFQASSTAKMLQQTGLLYVSQELWSRAYTFAQQGRSWLERNVPVYYSQAVDVLGPGLELAWEKTRDGLLYITQKCSTQTAYLKDNLPRFMDWLHSQIPDSVYQVFEYLRDLLIHLYRSFVLPAVECSEAAVQRAWQQYVDSCNGKVTWDCTRDHLTTVASSSWALLQNTTLAIKDWAVAMVSRH